VGTFACNSLAVANDKLFLSVAAGIPIRTFDSFDAVVADRASAMTVDFGTVIPQLGGLGGYLAGSRGSGNEVWLRDLLRANNERRSLLSYEGPLDGISPLPGGLVAVVALAQQTLLISDRRGMLVDKIALELGPPVSSRRTGGLACRYAP
jgi:hypothetical protein